MTKKSEYDMAEEVRAYNILLEEMRGHFQLVIEGLGVLTEKVSGLETKATSLEFRMDQLEIAMIQYNHDMKALRKDVNNNEDDVTILKSAVGIKV